MSSVVTRLAERGVSLDCLADAMGNIKATSRSLTEEWTHLPATADQADMDYLDALTEAVLDHYCGTVHAAAVCPLRDTDADPARGHVAAMMRACSRYYSAARYTQPAIHAAQGELQVRRIQDCFGDRHQYLDALHWLAFLYRSTGQLNEVGDCADEALEVFRRHHDDNGSAYIYRELGAIKLETDRADIAMYYLGCAVDLYDSQPDTPRMHRHRAKCHVLLGCAYWLNGSPTKARRCWDEAFSRWHGDQADVVREACSTMQHTSAPPSSLTTSLGTFGRGAQWTR